jgi:hypothetical protein
MPAVFRKIRIVPVTTVLAYGIGEPRFEILQKELFEGQPLPIKVPDFLAPAAHRQQTFPMKLRTLFRFLQNSNLLGAQV